jgi:hypothetical protein
MVLFNVKAEEIIDSLNRLPEERLQILFGDSENFECWLNVDNIVRI